MFIIQDWAGNIMFNGMVWASWDDAESFLSEQLADDYDDMRGEIYITEQQV